MKFRIAWLALTFLALSSAALFAQVPSLHDVHKNAGVACATCHQETPAAVAPPDATCVACHGTMIEPGDAANAPSPDPHRSPHLGPGEVPVCSECHKIHGKSEVTCIACHRGFQFDIK